MVKHKSAAASPGPEWASPAAYLRQNVPDEPVALFCPDKLSKQAKQFISGFPGLVTYAVKANPDPEALVCLSEAGLQAFDVASPAEMDLVHKLVPGAALHYNNPIRSEAEIATAIAAGVYSYSVDCASELSKLTDKLPARAVEISVRFKLPVSGAAYDFGAKFGAEPQEATRLLELVARSGHIPALCFHPGTQCTKPGVWAAYIGAARQIMADADTPIARLNVGGGFPSHRLAGQKPDLEAIFEEIRQARRSSFGDDGPELVCEPGRGMVGDAYALLTRIKAIRNGNTVFLNDGIYGGLAEHTSIGLGDRLEVYAPDGQRRRAKNKKFQLFGPTCDSIDELGKDQPLPADSAEGDYVVFQGMGAYAACLSTGFNGYGVSVVHKVASLSSAAEPAN